MKKRIPLLVIGVWAVVLVVAALSGLAQATVNCSGVIAWAAGGSYTVGELVTYQGSEYKCAQANNNAAPNWDPIDWPGGWTLVGTCTTGPTATATSTATATRTATATATRTATSTATATRTATATATRTATSTATATRTATATATATKTATATATATATGVGCYTPWISTTAYNGGATVSYNGVNYSAAFWSQGSEPDTNSGAAGSGKPWVVVGTCAATPTPTVTATPTRTATSTPSPTPIGWTPTPTPTAVAPPTTRVRAGYYIEWGVYGRAYYPSALPGSLTHVNYAFTNIDPVNLTCLNGVVKATTSNPEDPSQGDGAGDAYADYADTNLGQSGTLAGAFYQLKQWKASHSGSKILMSIGGWTYSKYFSDVAATDASRKKFVASCIDMYITGNLPAYSGYGGAGSGAGIFDGFDIDWEWPGDANGHPGNHTSAADKANLVALLKEFRTELNAKGSGYLLTAFLPGDPVKVSEGWDLTQIFNYLDFGNAQGYDFHGVGSDDTWDPNQTGNQAQLYATSTDPHGTTDFSDQLVINTYTSQGVSPSKLTIGIPFYGRGWQGVEAGTSGNGEWATVDGIGGKHAACGQFGCDTLLSGTWSTYPPSPQTGLFNGVPGCTISHDTAAVATFCFTGAGGQWWTFDDAWSVGQKMTWVNQQGLLGVMIWEMSGDNGTLMSPIAAAIK